jgi:Protein of unknown function (DUF2490)
MGDAPMRLRCLAAAAVSALAMGAPAYAQQHDFQQWTQMTVQGAVKDNLLVYFELQPRLWDNAGRLGQLLVRPAVGYRITADTNVLLGYAYVRTDPLGGRATDENRLWQQMIYPLLKTARLTVNGRSRLEQRTVVNANDLGWRIRQQVRAQGPLVAGGKVLGVVWNETFFNFNATDWGAREGFDQVRTFVGVQFPLSDRLNLEPGYLNQLIFRRGEDRMNHTLGIYLNYRL